MMACAAVAPSPASPATSNPVSSLRSVRIRSRASGSSSTIRTRVGGGLVCVLVSVVFIALSHLERGRGARRRDPLEGDVDQHGEPSVLVGELQTVQTAVETVEARAGIRQAHSGPEAFPRPHLEAAAVVADLHPETLADTPRADVNVVAAVPARDAVLDRVLDERLQDHPRHFAVERVGFDRHADSETILEARLFD